MRNFMEVRPNFGSLYSVLASSTKSGSRASECLSGLVQCFKGLPKGPKGLFKALIGFPDSRQGIIVLATLCFATLSRSFSLPRAQYRGLNS